MTAPSRPRQQTLRQLRQARGWTQQDVAERLGTSRSLVSRWERGETVPRARTQQRLAILFGVSVEAIAFGPGEQALG